MKIFSKIFAVIAVASFVFAACTKDAALPSYSTGNTPVLSSSKATVKPTSADSNNVVLTFSWTNPQYATSDSATNKYVLEIDSSGRNFSKSVKWVLTGSTSKSFTGKAYNELLLGLGFKFNVAYDIDVRLTSSYANNNDMKVSNTIKVNVTPYKIDPKVTPPTNLYIVGGATVGGWNNPVDTPSQKFSQIDETTFMGVFDLSGGEYLLLPVNGDWGQKYAITDNSVAGIADGGNFQYYNSGGQNFKAPTAAGRYLITVDFQLGKFTVVPYTGPELATDLFIVGNATPGGWNNPVPVPSQQFKRLNSCEFEMGSLAITGGNEYLLLPENGNWGKKYAIEDNTLAGADMAGTFKYYTSGGANFKAPTTSSNYKINVNFATAKYKLTKL